jgi:hypothetical protein
MVYTYLAVSVFALVCADLSSLLIVVFSIRLLMHKLRRSSSNYSLFTVYDTGYTGVASRGVWISAVFLLNALLCVSLALQQYLVRMCNLSSAIITTCNMNVHHCVQYR